MNNEIMKNASENNNEGGAIIRDPEKIVEEIKKMRANIEGYIKTCEENPENKFITKEGAKKMLEIAEKMEDCI